MMIEIFIPAQNWLKHLADAIKNAKTGEITQIVVDSHEKGELGKQAHAKMCPKKDVRFVIQ